MSTRRRSQSPAAGRGIRIALWSGGVLLVLGLVGVIGARAWVAGYLKSEEFRRFVSVKTGETLAADSDFAPLQVAGMSFYSDRFHARGSQRAMFSDLRVDQIRADVSARRFFDGVWQVDEVTAQQLDVKIDGTRIELPEVAPAPQREGGWMPSRVEVGSATIRETNLAWGEGAKAGGLRGTALAVAPRDGGWEFAGNGGRLEQAGFPALEVTALKLRYREPALFVQSAELREGTGGTVNVTGEVRFGDAVDLTAKLAGVSITPLLPEDWRVKLHGNLAGEITVRSPLPARGEPALSGTLRLEQGQLEALPILDQIALFTRAQQFRRLALSKATGDFQQANGRLEVRNFVAESEGLIRVEGSFTIVTGNIDGTFQIGVTPSTLQWLPGSQERVFTQQRAGYVWTPMRLTGPLAKPSEDLSPRLAAAAQGAVIEGAGNAVRETIKTGTDAAKGALDLLRPLLK